VRVFHADTMTELHDQMCTALIEASKEELDVISTVDVQIHNVIAQADSMDWDFDMKEMWLTKSRWSMMLNQYLDPEELTAWVERCTSKIGLRGRGIAVMRTKTVAARGGEATGHTNKETRRWGSCMLAVSYKAVPRPQITLYSRTSYLGYIGALDLTVAWMLGKTLAKDMGIDVKDIQFVWMNEAIQWHNFKSLAFLLNHPSKKRRKKYRRLMMTKAKKLDNKEQDELEYSPALRLSRKWLAKVIQDDKDGRTYGDMTYNTFRRIVRRYHTEVHGLEYAQQFEGWSRYKTGPKEGKKKEFFKAYNPLPSVHCDTLDMSALTKKGAKLEGAEYVGGADDEDDDDE
jgi:hypothetical protein